MEAGASLEQKQSFSIDLGCLLFIESLGWMRLDWPSSYLAHL
jgi:hypothetical protein